MLSMSNVTSVAAAGAYYAEDNYYSEGENQARSAWEGRGAAELGLSGIVDTKTFEQVLSGVVGDQQLGRVTGRDADGELIREHRPGYDVTLSAPKSVSILAEVGGATDVRAAHEAATSKVLEYIENNLVGARVTEDGMTRFEQTDNVIVGRFHHTTSRALDPQTHTHLVIANATQTEDGVWRSLSNELLYKNQALLGVIYDAELAANLRTLGYRLETGQDGRWEIAGISREQIEHFSQRSRDIEARLEGFGLSRDTATAAQREDAALRTRDSKQEVDHAELRQQWRDRAAAVGIDFAKLEADRAQGATRDIDPAFTSTKADEAVRFAVLHLTEREAVVPRGLVLETAVSHATKETVWAGVRLEHVEAALAKQLEEKFALKADRGDITTAEALAREQKMLALMDGGRGATKAIAAASDVERAINDFEAKKSEALGTPFKMTQGQAEATRLALGSEDRFIGLQGFAGVGKTTMLELVNERATAAGYTVRGMASSGEAAMQLQKEAGIESVTTARFLLDEGRRSAEASKPQTIALTGTIDLAGNDVRTLEVTLPRKTGSQGRTELWVLDEGSLTGQREMTSLMAMAERAGAKLMIVGDKLQLNAVEAGKPFEVLQRHGIASAEMTEISRQRVADLQQAVAHAVRRDNAAALAGLDKRVVEIEDKGQLLQRVAGDVLAKHGADRANALVIAPLNEDRKAINNLVRAKLQDRGEIASNKLERQVLVKADLTDEQRSWAVYYQPGMAVRFGGELKRLGVAQGEYGRVAKVDHDRKTVALTMEDGRTVTWNPARNSKVEVYKQENRQLAVGDELRFTRPNKDLGVVNGTFAKVSAIEGDHIKVTTKAGEVTLDARQLQHAHLEYAYAMTVYSSQGKTVNDVSMLITKDSGQAMGQRAFYVGITRERDDLTIYTDSKGKAMDIIERAQNKTSAIESLKADKEGSVGETEGKVQPATKGAGGKAPALEI
jgi:conjugative relaxase-like TrwC/TraI family protein